MDPRASGAVRGRLPRAFYARGAADVAPELLGAILVHRRGPATVAARIVEVEAYVGEHDQACHARRGRTPRTLVMFGPPGHAYVYFVYGMHCLLNVVTAPEGDAQAVLIRAAEPIANVSGPTNGPGRLTRSLGITLAHNGADLCRGGLYIRPGVAPGRVAVAARVGVGFAGSWAEAPLRFYDPESSWVSKR